MIPANESVNKLGFYWDCIIDITHCVWSSHMSMVGEHGKSIPSESAPLPYVHGNILDTKVMKSFTNYVWTIQHLNLGFPKFIIYDLENCFPCRVCTWSPLQPLYLPLICFSSGEEGLNTPRHPSQKISIILSLRWLLNRVCMLQGQIIASVSPISRINVTEPWVL